MIWQVVCPDGFVRHYPYNNYDDATFDAAVYDRLGCRLYDTPNDLERSHPRCVGTPHRVESIGFARRPV